MPHGNWRAAIFAALLHIASLSGAVLLFASPALAQDVTLTSRDGALAISGTLISHDGEFYRLNTEYGPMVLDAEGVVCDGPGCPDLTSPRAVIHIVGLAQAGSALLPGLISAFADSRSMTVAQELTPTQPAILQDPTSAEVRVEIHFQAMDGDGAAAALAGAEADLVLTAAVDAGGGGSDRRTRLIGLDPMVVILSADNPMSSLTTGDLARILSGEIENWKQLSGPDMPLVLHGLDPQHPYAQVLAARLGRAIVADTVHGDLLALSAAVQHDPWAIAVTGRSVAGAARQIALTDSCGFPLLAEDHSVKSEDYPLVLPIAFALPKRRLPLAAREFLEFLNLPAGQAAVASAGFTDKSPQIRPMTQDGWRLINAVKGAGSEAGLAELQRLVGLMERAQRMSYTFRFQGGATELDAHSADSLDDLAQRIAAGLIDPADLILVGFSDGSGKADANLALSQERALAVQAELAKALPDLTADSLPRVEAFGETLPIACDETAAGRHLNRRVELWVLPK